MKFNIAVNQLALADTKLDLLDAAILDYLYFYCSSMNAKVEAQRIRDDAGVWTWINYGTLLLDMPLLRVKTTSSLTPRIQAIEEAGYISTRRVANQKLFVKLNSLVDELFAETNRAVRETKQSYSFKRTNNTTKDNNTKNIIPEREKLNLSPFLDAFKEVNPSWQRLYRNTTERAALARLLDAHGAETVGKWIGALPQIIVQPYAPRITTPYQLEMKLGDLMAFLSQNKSKQKNKVATV